MRSPLNLKRGSALLGRALLALVLLTGLINHDRYSREWAEYFFERSGLSLVPSGATPQVAALFPLFFQVEDRLAPNTVRSSDRFEGNEQLGYRVLDTQPAIEAPLELNSARLSHGFSVGFRLSWAQGQQSPDDFPLLEIPTSAGGLRLIVQAQGLRAESAWGNALLNTIRPTPGKTQALLLSFDRTRHELIAYRDGAYVQRAQLRQPQNPLGPWRSVVLGAKVSSVKNQGPLMSALALWEGPIDPKAQTRLLCRLDWLYGLMAASYFLFIALLAFATFPGQCRALFTALLRRTKAGFLALVARHA